MKKLIISAIIALLLITVVVLEQVYLNNSFSQLEAKVDVLSQQVSLTENINTEQIQNTIYDLEEYWQNTEKVLCMTINYNDLHRIGEQLQRVKAYIEQNQKDDCVAEIEVLDFYAESFRTIFLTNFSNIF